MHRLSHWTPRRLIGLVLAVLVVLSGLGYALLLAIARVVDGDSMTPTLHSGDRVLIHSSGQPRRFDIVALTPPGAQALVIKRVLGVPGDRVQIRADTTAQSVLIQPGGKGKFQAVGYRRGSGRGSTGPCCPAGTSDAATPSFAKPVLIPPGKYFVLGDNPAVSEDSRGYGLVDASSIKGRVLFRVWPPSGTQSGPELVPLS